MEIMQRVKFLVFTIVSIIIVFLISQNANAQIWSGLNLVATISGVLCVFLVAKKDIRNYYVGVIAVSTYGLVAYHYGYLYDYLLNIYILIPVQVIGYYYWSNYKHDNSKRIEVAEIKYQGVIYLISVIAIILLSTVFYNVVSIQLKGSPSNLPQILKVFDAVTTVFTLLAQYMMIKRYAQQWVLWIIVNLGSIIMWIYFGDLNLVLMFTVYLIVAIYGYFNWNKK